MLLNFLCVLAIIFTLSLVIRTSELYEEDLRCKKKVTDLNKSLHFKGTKTERLS